MRATTIRFSPELWSILEREARREGVSVAQFVREAALFRAAYGLGGRSERSESSTRFKRLEDEVRGELERARSKRSANSG
jgi:Ribbon-helix-helix domain